MTWLANVNGWFLIGAFVLLCGVCFALALCNAASWDREWRLDDDDAPLQSPLWDLSEWRKR